MRILIVDDHPIYAEGLKNLLLSWDYTDVSVAADGPAAVSLARRLRPDVVLMDISMPGMDGIQATAEIKRDSPETKVVMLTSLGEEESLLRAVKAGASGYLIKTLTGEQLVGCLRDLEAGKNPFSAGLEERLLAEIRRNADVADSQAGDGLTVRQREVLALMARGLSYKEIGGRICISERTVKFHVEQIKAALGIQTREELITFARRQGL